MNVHEAKSVIFKEEQRLEAALVKTIDEVLAKEEIQPKWVTITQDIRDKTFSASIDPVVASLRLALNADPEAMDKLITRRVKCNDRLADHPHISVTQDNMVGGLGLINGVLAALGYHQTVGIVVGPDGEIENFFVSLKVEVEEGE
jgi:hypothetical protein